jgi:hypothetical protein
VLANFGIAIAAKMPMITTTIRSSIRVKPLRSFNMLVEGVGSGVANEFQEGIMLTHRGESGATKASRKPKGMLLLTAAVAMV